MSEFAQLHSKRNLSGAKPKLKGKADLNDEWHDVPVGGDSNFRFFNIKVEMPQ